MKRVKLLALGLIPGIVGLIYLLLISGIEGLKVGSFRIYPIFVVLYSLLSVLVYYFLGRFAREYSDTFLEGLVFTNLFTMLAFVLAFIQIIISNGLNDGILSLLRWTYFVSPVYSIMTTFSPFGYSIITPNLLIILVTFVIFIIAFLFGSKFIRAYHRVE